MTTPTTTHTRIGPLAVAGFTVSLAAVLLANPLPPGGVALGVVAVVLSTLGLRRAQAEGARARLAVAGLVVGIVAIVGAILNATVAATVAPQLLQLLD